MGTGRARSGGSPDIDTAPRFLLYCLPEKRRFRAPAIPSGRREGTRSERVIATLRFRKIKPRVLLVHMLVTLLYPVFRAFIAENDRLLVFTDAITVIGLVMVACGILYALVLRGDFDISAFLLKRGIQKEPKQTFRAYLYEVYEKREEAFNYPLFLGLLYLAAAFALSYCII